VASHGAENREEYRDLLGGEGVLWSIEYGSLEVVIGGLAGRVDGADNRIMIWVAERERGVDRYLG